MNRLKGSAAQPRLTFHQQHHHTSSSASAPIEKCLKNTWVLGLVANLRCVQVFKLITQVEEDYEQETFTEQVDENGNEYVDETYEQETYVEETDENGNEYVEEEVMVEEEEAVYED